MLACTILSVQDDFRQLVEDTEYGTLPGGVGTVTYKVVSGRELKMDVLHPTKHPDGPAPAYLVIHGVAE